MRVKRVKVLWSSPTRCLILSFQLIASLAGTLFAVTELAPPVNSHSRIPPHSRQLPLYFEPNHGQAASSVKFLARGPGYRLFLTPSEAALVLKQGLVKISLPDSNAQPRIEGMGFMPGKSNYFLGSDSQKWLTGVGQYAKVAYKQVYPGIDMIYEGDASQLEYSFIVAPGADPDVIRMDFAGVDTLRLDPEGNLVLSFSGKPEAAFKAPVLYQQLNGERAYVRGRFVLAGNKRVRFEVGDYIRSQELIIDPTLLYSTYNGGLAADRAYAVAVDATGNTYITGATTSNPFPDVGAQYQSSYGGGASDVFVTKINPAGTAVVWSTYLGGGGDDRGNGIAVDAAGNVYLTGSTTAGGFPVTALPFQAASGGGTDAFVAALNPSGTALNYSTYLGGTGSDGGNAIVVNALGTAYIAGHTDSGNFPVSVGAFQGIAGGADDAFVASFNAAGARLYASYLGGTTADHANAVGIDRLGNAYLTGLTSNGTFPVTPTAPPTSAAFYLTVTGATDAFVAKVNPTGTSLLYATFLGGSGDDEGTAIAVGEPDVVYVTGFTGSGDFPYLFTRVGQITPGVAAPDAFVFKLHMGNGGGFNDGVYATYLGGATDDVGLGIAVDAAGRAYVSGRTSSLDFPTVNPLPGQAVLGATGKAFVTELNPTGTAHLFSTYLGGGTDQAGTGIALDAENNIYITGWTNSADFPTAPVTPIQASNAGTFDAFAAKISAPTPVPPAPVLIGTALGISSISWSWNAVVGATEYRIYQATSTTTLVATTPTLNFIETGLSTNTAYGRVITATVSEESALSLPTTTYTLAQTPGTPLFTNVSFTSFTVTWAANNPLGTRFEVSRSTTNDNFATGVSTPIGFADDFLLGTTDFVNLMPGTTYYLRVRAENGAVAGGGIPTSFSSTASTSTRPTLLPPPPTGLVGTALGISSISWTWNAVPGADAYHLYQATSPTTLVVSTPSVGFIETGLSSNTAYGRVISALISGDEGALSTAATTYTLAAVPGAGVFTNVFSTSFTVTWPTQNPAGTRFEVSRSTTNDNFATAVSTPITFASNFTFGTTTFISLVPGTTYYVRIRAENGVAPLAGIVTFFSATTSTVTVSSSFPTGLAGTALGTSSITWTWNAVPGATSYTLYQATSPTTVVGQSVTPSFIETGLSANTDYGRRVTATELGVESLPSAAATAYTLAAPLIPAPDTFSLTPITGPDAGGTEVVITGSGFTGATGVTFGGYQALRFIVDSDEQITTWSPAQAAGSAVDVSVARRSGATAAGTYTFSPTMTPSTSGPGSYIFPSPAHGPTARIVYTMAESGSVKIRVYNEAGDLVTRIDDEKPAGVQISTVHTDRLSPGVYFYILRATYASGQTDNHQLKKFVVKH